MTSNVSSEEKASIEKLLSSINKELEERRGAITRIIRIVNSHKDTFLHKDAIMMAIPMFYAHWEGFAKSCLTLYLEFINETKTPQREIKPDLLAHAWNDSFKAIANNLKHDKKVELINNLVGRLDDCFNIKKPQVDTKSNLKAEVLMDICKSLCLNVESISSHTKYLNALVNRRNSIAHGNSNQSGIPATQKDLDDYKENAFNLFQALESAIQQSVQNNDYRYPTSGMILEDDKSQV